MILEIVQALGNIGGSVAETALMSVTKTGLNIVGETAYQELNIIASRKFDSGGVESSIDLFAYLVLCDYVTDEVLNNYAFCLIFKGRFDEAEEHLTRMESWKDNGMLPIYLHNLALTQFKLGDKESAKRTLQTAIERQKDTSLTNDDAYTTLFLDGSGAIQHTKEIPLVASMLNNLYRMELTDWGSLMSNMSEIYADKSENYIGFIRHGGPRLIELIISTGISSPPPAVV